jgi:gluconolactonase
MQRYLDFHSVMRVWPGSSHVEPVVDDLEAPNGITFSPDERLLYVNDTARRHIRVFDVQADGMLANGRIFYEAEADYPAPFDGMKVDVEGNVYCTAPGGIHVIKPDGSLLVRIRFPRMIGNIAWGGPDWTWMFCTMLGAMYRIDLKIPGVPVGKR